MILNGVCVCSPGTYLLESTLGISSSSSIRSSPLYSIKGRNYPDGGDSEMSVENPGFLLFLLYLSHTSNCVVLLVSPGQYDTAEKFQGGSTVPRYSFPKSKRPSMGDGKRGPGAGEYGIKDSLGKQVLSSKPSSSIAIFGTGNRPPLLNMSSSDVGPGLFYYSFLLLLFLFCSSF